jgi:hypothetical protein
MTTDPADGIMFEKHNSPADDLVTEEIIVKASDAYDEVTNVNFKAMRAALRAVAPMIAARALVPQLTQTATALAKEIGEYNLPGNGYEAVLVGINALVAAEREAIARDLMDAGWEEAADYVLERGHRAQDKAD